MGSDIELKIISDQSIANSIFWQKRISLGRNDFGLLIGSIVKKGDISVISVDDIFPVGKLANADEILEGEQWQDIRSRAMTKYSDKKIVGWYGIRNGWGAMMMEEDRSLHKKHFKGLNHIMYLLDDRGGLRNFYIWEGNSLILYKQSGESEPLELLKEGRELPGGRKWLDTKNFKWLGVALAAIILITTSYTKLLKPVLKGEWAGKGEVDSISEPENGHEDDDNRVDDNKPPTQKHEDSEDEDEMETSTLKEVIAGLEEALDEMGKELDTVKKDLDEKNAELEDKIKQVEEKDKQIIDLEKAKEDALARAESGQDSSQMRVYVFQDGDTLSGLSSKFYGNIKYSNDLGRVNRITDHNAVRTGTYLIIPPKDVIEDMYSRRAGVSD